VSGGYADPASSVHVRVAAHALSGVVTQNQSLLVAGGGVLTGAGVLIVEVLAVRVLSPYYGNTIFTVSSVISVVLLALSAGYYIGGSRRIARPRCTRSSA
jgi:hypothetical protein